MRDLRNRADNYLYAITLWCIFSFKLILVGLGESGIRTDDILILVAFLILLFRGEFRSSVIPRSRPFNLYLVFVLINFLSALWNSIAGRIFVVTSFLYATRLLQYMIFYYLGAVIAKSGRTLKKPLIAYFIFLMILVPLQMLGLAPTFGSFAGATSRAVGNTNGPYELAAVAGFLLCFLFYSYRGWLQAVGTMLLILLSASRATAVAAVLSLIKVFSKRASVPLRSIALFSTAFLAVALSFLIWSFPIDPSRSDVVLVSRLSSLTSTNIANMIGKVYANAPIYDSATSYQAGAFMDAVDVAEYSEGQSGEVSGAIRAFRWTTLIKSTLAHADSVLIGLGPSFGSAAVDGYFVRVFVETGVIGMVSFLVFAFVLLRDTGRTCWQLREYAIILFLTGSFIDICVSYKPMLFLWLWHGMSQFSGRSGPLADHVSPVRDNTA